MPMQTSKNVWKNDWNKLVRNIALAKQQNKYWANCKSENLTPDTPENVLNWALARKAQIDCSLKGRPNFSKIRTFEQRSGASLASASMHRNRMLELTYVGVYKNMTVSNQS
jgi:hypothetical protein